MVITCSIRDVKLHNADVNFAIVQSMKTPIKGVIQLAALAPSKELFCWYLKNRERDGWFEEYERKFIADVIPSWGFQEGTRVLIELVKLDKNVTLSCYCSDLDKCHRKIVGKYLQSLGIEILIN